MEKLLQRKQFALVRLGDFFKASAYKYVYLCGIKKGKPLYYDSGLPKHTSMRSRLFLVERHPPKSLLLPLTEAVQRSKQYPNIENVYY